MRFTKTLVPLLSICIISVISWVIASQSKKIDIKDHVNFASKEQKLKLKATAKYDIRDITVLENNEVWAIGYEGQYLPMVWHSSDGGNTWESYSSPNDQLESNSIDFINHNYGWIVGIHNNLIRTIDGGKSWEEIIVPTKATLQVVRFVNSKVGYVSGTTSYKDKKTETIVHGLEILRTIDGGKNWVTCYQNNELDLVFDLAVLSEDIALVSLEGNSLLRTEDGGTTWKIVASGSWSFLSIAFNSEGVGYSVGRNGFYRSTDKGKTWEKLGDFSSDLLNRTWISVDFADTKEGAAISEDGVIVLTVDDGITWFKGQEVTDDKLAKIRLQGHSGVIVGEQKVYVFDF